MTGDNPVDLTILEEPMPANYYHGDTDGMPTADAGNLSDFGEITPTKSWLGKSMV